MFMCRYAARTSCDIVDVLSLIVRVFLHVYRRFFCGLALLVCMLYVPNVLFVALSRRNNILPEVVESRRNLTLAAQTQCC